ncbi:uncharacterized protein LOC129285300 [Prosopis cineraria]|uniref:uncharacterized protein LOC129285300 n=1 Tax=Prosopis cineraria TaxID=364024 RepID=UPI00240F8E91|nr:uncharacterized protein LOC129285300 [Prosopis cineraria]XP_054776901.1 uncharacterized protein LOC129285300 [Prosopis cineraria]XP_054776902.1 uncharacterized protein LOC129285300 [Prosopis cineraria]XP_054776903.1 uncharacterized protein LOC129285300 [Prosopis cineraria]
MDHACQHRFISLVGYKNFIFDCYCAILCSKAAFQTLVRRGWMVYLTNDKFQYYIPALVREFYVNAFYCYNDTYWVRDKEVVINAEVIQNYYGFPSTIDCLYRQYEMNVFTPDWDAVAKRLCFDSTSFCQRGLLRGTLTRQSTFWFHFVAHNVMPTSNASEMNKDHSFLIYCIMERKLVNLIAIIYDSIKRCINVKTKRAFAFPHLITELLLAIKVPIIDDEEQQQPRQPIKYHKMHAKSSRVEKSLVEQGEKVN